MAPQSGDTSSGDRITTLITGASRGIGRALADDLERNGHFVINLSRSAPDGDFNGLHMPCDLADEKATAAALEEVTGAHEVDNLVNNAGLIGPSTLDGISFDEFRTVTEVNVRAAMQCAKALVPSMRRKGAGRIVNISSRASLGKAERSSYSAAKAALIGLTRTWALELGREGITVNAVAPGPIATELFWRGNTQEYVDRLAASAPLGRIGRPEDVAHAIRFFLDPAASFVTGQVLYVCGGTSVGTVPV